MDNLKWLQKWYQENCDGEWEHMYGVEIATLDNPGWHVIIDLTDTKYEKLENKDLKIDISENNWMRCFINNRIYDGCGDSGKLEEIIETFKKWICSL